MQQESERQSEEENEPPPVGDSDTSLNSSARHRAMRPHHDSDVRALLELAPTLPPRPELGIITPEIVEVISSLISFYLSLICVYVDVEHPMGK